MLLSLAALAPRVVLASQDPGFLPEPLRVLLVGNSYTRFNMLPVLLQRIAEAVPQGPALRVQSVAHGGYTLRRHWLQREARLQIRRGHYTHVVLQDHSMRAIDRPDEMTAYVERFDELIAAAGAKTVLYETWARQPGSTLYRKRPELGSSSSMQERIAFAYSDLARRRGAALAPVGNAFMLALAQQPELSLYRADGAHPTLQGSYLAGCVLYRAITALDPRSTTYVPYGLSEEEAIALRELAASTESVLPQPNQAP